MNKYKVLELCAGAGGLALGIEKAGFKTSYLIEYDKTAAKTLISNRPNWNVIVGDINVIANEGISSVIKESIDLISGGFPCQPFSYAGKGLGFEDHRGNLFFSFAKMIKDLKPKALLFENVKGLVNHGSGRTFFTIKTVLDGLGYNIYSEVLNAWNYGVAQKRERLFIIGIRKDFDTINAFEFPKPSKNKKVLRDILKNVPDSQYIPYSEKKIKVLNLVPPGGCWRHLPEDVAREYMKNSYFLKGGKTGIARRLSWNEPSLTLTTSSSQMQTERCHPDETRPFTIRESARIQSFPDKWEFFGSISQKYKQIGNAVPVDLAKEVAKKLKKYLKELENVKK